MNQRIEVLQKIIKTCEQEIVTIRQGCPHTEVYDDIWEWAPGHQFPADICSDCGTMVKSKLSAPGVVTTSAEPH